MTSNQALSSDDPDSPKADQRWSLGDAIRVASIALVLKIAVFAAAYSLAHDITEARFTVFSKRWPPAGSPDRLTPLATWDVAHYLYLAENKYQEGDDSCAFYPLWPSVLGWVGGLSGRYSPVDAALLANGLLFGAYVIFLRVAVHYRLLAEARLACLIHALCPGAVFMSVGYSESCFLFLLALAIYLTEVKQSVVGTWVWLLLPLTRAVGVFLALPSLVRAIASGQRRHFAVFGMTLTGWGFYFCLMHWSAGSWDAGIVAQRFFPNQPSVGNFFDVRTLLGAFCNVGSFHNPLDSFLDRSLFILTLASIPWIFRESRVAGWFTVAMGLVPAGTNLFLSYTRFSALVVTLPLLWSGVMLRTRLRWPTVFVVLGVLGCGQVYCATRFFEYEWAG